LLQRIVLLSSLTVIHLGIEGKSAHLGGGGLVKRLRLILAQLAQNLVQGAFVQADEPSRTPPLVFTRIKRDAMSDHFAALRLHG